MNGTTQKSILVLIGVVATAGIGGAVAAPANTVHIFGFSAMICVSLFGLLQQMRQSTLTQETKEVVIKAAETAADGTKEVKQTLEKATTIQEAKIDALVTKSDSLAVKSDHIIVLTNSTLTAAKDALVIAEKRIAKLEKLTGLEPHDDVPEKLA